MSFFAELMKYEIAEGFICLISISRSKRISLIIFSESSESYIEKLFPNPTISAFCLSIIAPIEWNVPIRGIFSPSTPKS